MPQLKKRFLFLAFAIIICHIPILQVNATSFMGSLDDNKEGEWYEVSGFEGQKVKFDKETGTLTDIYPTHYRYSAYSVEITTAVVPETIDGTTVTAIGDNAFAVSKYLISVTLPETITHINEYAFGSCYELESINLPDALIYLGDQAFSNCYKLDHITFPKNLQEIGSSVFANNKLITIIEIPDGVQTIAYNAFTSVTNVAEYYIPTSVNYLGSSFLNPYGTGDIYYSGTLEQWNEIQAIYYDGSFQSKVSTGNYSLHFLEDSSLPSQTENDVFLPNAVLHTSYLTTIHDINPTSTLISGNLPKGLGLYADGVIGGIPQETGEFQFVIATSQGEVGYSITVEEPTAQNVEANNDFDIIKRVPTVDNNVDDQIFQVSGEYGDFLNLYINGELLVRDVHYFVSEGSTVLTVAGQTMSQLNSGSNTINATFAQTNATVTPTVSSGSTSSSGSITTNSTSQSANVASVAQVFNKTVEPEPLMAMPFTDVAVSDWHYQYVRYMYDTGTFYGITDTTYEPNTGMTRAMMAVVFYGMANKPSSGSANFSDVADGQWYADAVNWISTSGIDDSVGTFRPTEMITREETAKMMHNFCTDQGVYIPITTSRTPNDMDSVSDNAKNAVNVLFSKGIFAGDNWDNFNPHNTSTRAEISAMMRTFMWATV